MATTGLIKQPPRGPRLLPQGENHGECIPQYHGPGVCWSWWIGSYVVAGPLGELGKCIYHSEILGVRISVKFSPFNHSAYFLVTGPLRGGTVFTNFGIFNGPVIENEAHNLAHFFPMAGSASTWLILLPSGEYIFRIFHPLASITWMWSPRVRSCPLNFPNIL